MRDVAEWLASISLEEYVELFADNDIDLLVVRDLTEQDLKELGVSLGHRRKILRSASELVRLERRGRGRRIYRHCPKVWNDAN